MKPRGTVHVRRAQRRADAALALRAAIERHTTQAAAAAAIGVDASLVGDWCNPEHAATISIADLAALDVHVVREVVRAVLLPEELSVPDPASVDTGCDLRQSTEALVSASEASSLALEAWADGTMTRDEAGPVIEAVDRALARLVAVRERARVAIREGVVPMRSPLRALHGGKP